MEVSSPFLEGFHFVMPRESLLEVSGWVDRSQLPNQTIINTSIHFNIPKTEIQHDDAQGRSEQYIDEIMRNNELAYRMIKLYPFLLKNHYTRPPSSLHLFTHSFRQQSILQIFRCAFISKIRLFNLCVNFFIFAMRACYSNMLHQEYIIQERMVTCQHCQHCQQCQVLGC